MRTFLTVILSLLATLYGMAAEDTLEYSVEGVPNVRLYDDSQHLSDPTALLSTQARDTINALFTQLEKETGIEVAVVMLPSIGEHNAFDFAHQLFRYWGVGKKKSDNGLVILYVEDQHAIRFVTGYGIEGTLTDALCKRIQMRHMVPAFKNGDRDGGMVEGCKAVSSTLKGTMEAEEEEEDVPTALVSALIIAVIVLLAFMKDKLTIPRRCPRCGKKALKRKRTTHYNVGKMHFRKDTWVCGKCGHKEEEKSDEPDNDDDYDGSSGLFFGSIFSGGGNSGGGSFGGGSSGGGGAGSNW